MRAPSCAAAVCGGLLLAGCADRPVQPYTMTYTPPAPLISGDADRNAPSPVPSYIPTQVDSASVYVPIWKAMIPDLANDAATAGMTVGGMELAQRMKAAQGAREDSAKRFAIDAEEDARAATKWPTPKLPAPAEGGGAATAERKLTGNLLTREGVAVAAGAAERKAAKSLLIRGSAAAEERAVGTMLMRGAVAAEEGEGLAVLLRLLLFL